MADRRIFSLLVCLFVLFGSDTVVSLVCTIYILLTPHYLVYDWANMRIQVIVLRYTTDY